VTWQVIAAVALAWLLGALAVGHFWRRRTSGAFDWPLSLSLGLGVGLGLSSAIFFAATLISDHPARISAGLEVLLSAALSWPLWRAPRTSVELAPPVNRRLSVGEAILGSLFAQACLLATVMTVRAAEREPYGSWDGWAIWNLHARFLFLGGTAWPRLLAASQLGWSHPDYPLLVPASVARIWAYAGADLSWLSGLVSTLFGVATVGILVAGVSRLRGRIIGWIGGLVLLDTPFFVTFSSNEHADIPLSFFILATAIVLAMSTERSESPGLPALAGILAGLAAWTKNEGLLFALIVTLVWCGDQWRRGSWRTTLTFFGGLALGLLPVAYFKFVLAPPNDLLASRPSEHLARLIDAGRHWQILSAFWHDGNRFGEWWIAPFLGLALAVLGPIWKKLHRAEGMVAAIIGLTLAGYYGVYLLTPWDLAWHLEFSLVRLLLQLWPAAIFLWCLVVGSKVDSEARDPSVSTVQSWTAVIATGGINALLASAILMALSRQLAPNQFAAAHLGGVEISAMVGDGWYERETDRRETWRWSKGGGATLWINIPAGQAPSFTLQFGIRSLGFRTVTARVADRLIWSDRVGPELRFVNIGALTFSPGWTAIDFATDAAGIPESVDPDARALTYALYDVQLK
jgi:hypothetical protein